MTRVADVQLVHAKGKGGDQLRTWTWIEVQLIGEDGNGIAGEEYSIRVPGGRIVTGTLDAQGLVRIADLPAGTCQVSFPKLDKDAWVPVETNDGADAAAEGKAA